EFNHGGRISERSNADPKSAALSLPDREVGSAVARPVKTGAYVANTDDLEDSSDAEFLGKEAECSRRLLLKSKENLDDYEARLRKEIDHFLNEKSRASASISAKQHKGAEAAKVWRRKESQMQP
ncbi:unnamed protein product, partial [Amoebophrya sp. A25]